VSVKYKPKKERLLPEKLSDCLEVALTDLEKCEKDKRYRINMGDWHKPNGKCAVCLAGSAMACTLKVPIRTHLEPWQMDRHNSRRLRAINHLREGDIRQAVNDLALEFPDACPSFLLVANYEDDRRQFKAEMRLIVRTLRNYGL
jgi:hypothetical protein